MNKTRWIYKENHVNDELKEMDIDSDILNILINRKIDNKDKILSFFDNNLSSLQNPFLLKDVDKAIERIIQAIESKELIYIYGDYDVDGITSTSICYLALKELGANVDYYIPLRDEGYGLSNDALSSIKESGASIVISVDCGISSLKEALHAKELGLDLIITDHHEITSTLPEAFAIINPKRTDQEYSFKNLAGCGTAFLLLLALFEKFGVKEKLYKYIDIVAIGTIADIVPLVEENRIFSKNGLEKLRNTENIGLNTLLSLIFEDYKTREYTSYDVGFLIAPIFNAAGRLEDAKRAVELLVTPSKENATKISLKLIEQNNERKTLQKEILEAVEKDITNRELYEKYVIVSASEEFHHGVIGIVASKIVDKYYKPTIIMEIKAKEGFAVASCRSIDGFHLLNGLNSMKELFIKYGGHAGAAGFSIPIDKISEFEERINLFAKENIEDETYLKPIIIDKSLLFNKISYSFFNKLDNLKPFGFGNNNPTFAVKNVKLSNVRLIGKDKSHLMLDINKDNLTIKNCVWFGNGHQLDELQNFPEVDIAFKPKIELFNDKYYPKVYIEDIICSKEENSEIKKYFELYDTGFPLETIIYPKAELLLTDKLGIEIKDSKVYVTKNGRIYGFLDDILAYTLCSLHNYYGFTFGAKALTIQKTNSNYQIKIEIFKTAEFTSLSFRDGDIFKDIKNHLLGLFNYNSMQKMVLGKVFKEGQNIILENSAHRGEKTLIKTIVLFNKMKDKKLLFVTKNLEKFKFLDGLCAINTQFENGYDYYIFYDYIPKEIPNNFLIFSKAQLNIENSITINGTIQLPSNIILENERNLKNLNQNEIVFSRKLPISARLDIIENLKTYSKVYATKDILKVL